MGLRVLLISLMFATSAMAAELPDKLSDLPCQKQILQTINKYGTTGDWLRTVDPQEGVYSYRSPTNELARWVEIQSYKNPYLFLFETGKTRVHQWNRKTCNMIVSSDTKPLNFLLNKKATFTDDKLKKLLNGKKNAIIYLWSPAFVYSLTDIDVFIEVAKDMDFEFIPVLDHQESLKAAKAAVRHYAPKLNIEKFRSLELYMREGTIHYPASYIISNGKISSKIFGAQTVQTLTERINEKLAVLRRTH